MVRVNWTNDVNVKLAQIFFYLCIYYIVYHNKGNFTNSWTVEDRYILDGIWFVHFQKIKKLQYSSGPIVWSWKNLMILKLASPKKTPFSRNFKKIFFTKINCLLFLYPIGKQKLFQNANFGKRWGGGRAPECYFADFT